MWHLFSSELLRFRALAVGVALAHLLVLRLAAASTTLFSADFAVSSLALLTYGALALALGLYQLGSLRRPGHWVFLIHRPLAPGRIFAALAAAALVLLAGVVALPIVAIAAYTRLLTPMAVDGRHDLLALYAFGIAASCYFLGAWIALARSRSAFLAGVLVIFFLTREAVGWWLLVPQMIVVVWLAGLARAAFKPDLAAPLRTRPALAAAALALGYAFFRAAALALVFINSIGTIVATEGVGALGRFAWNDYFPPGTLEHVGYLDERSALLHGLDAAHDPLRTQLGLARVIELPHPGIGVFPTRHQPVFADGPSELHDTQTGVRWSFRHGEMRFQGIDLRTGEAAGWLGVDGLHTGAPAAARRWPAVPIVAGERWVLLPRQLFEVDFRRGTVDLRFELPAGEVFTVPLSVADTFALAASDRALYFFEPRELARPARRLAPLAVLPLPVPARRISRTLVAELVDGWVISWVIGHGERDLEPPVQQVVELGLDGGWRQVATRPLAQGFPAWYRHRGFWISPMLQTAHDLAWLAIAPHRPERATLGEILARPAPVSVLGLAALCALLSAGATAALAARRGLEARERWGWTLAALGLGLPGFLAFLSLTMRDEALGLPAAVRAGEPRVAATVLGAESWAA